VAISGSLGSINEKFNILFQTTIEVSSSTRKGTKFKINLFMGKIEEV